MRGYPAVPTRRSLYDSYPRVFLSVGSADRATIVFLGIPTEYIVFEAAAKLLLTKGAKIYIHDKFKSKFGG